MSDLTISIGIWNYIVHACIELQMCHKIIGRVFFVYCSQARVKRMMIQSFPIKETLVIHDFVVSTLIQNQSLLWFLRNGSYYVYLDPIWHGLRSYINELGVILFISFKILETITYESSMHYLASWNQKEKGLNTKYLPINPYAKQG